MKSLAVVACMLTGLTMSLWAADTRRAADSAPWSGQSAAAYLEGRLKWWMTWPPAARDHETFCVSCHTVVPYSMARPALRAALAEPSASELDHRLLDNVAKRVRMWNEEEPFYPGAKAGESRGTESVLNALILADYDALTGKLSADARLAFDRMWSQQLAEGEGKGAWPWFQFHYAPWEGDSQFYGATLAAIAVGTAPGNYRSAPEIQDSLALLREYLARQRAAQTPIDRVMLLWASTKLPGLLTRNQQKTIVEEALSRQRADGGFSLTSLVGKWQRKDGTPLETRSDGYATGVVAFVLQQAGVARRQPTLRRSLEWLEHNQDRTDGRWLAWSLNKQRDPVSDIGRFMSDAATAFAVMALDPRSEASHGHF
ncbi:MAG: hypothetical protein LAP87_05970 [Acidobacteriia bacterium]|nr:hypothetical protein [Terriglobia bacterium]